MLSNLTPGLRSADSGSAALLTRLWFKWTSDNLGRNPQKNRVWQHCRTRFPAQWTFGNLAKGPKKSGLTILSNPIAARETTSQQYCQNVSFDLLATLPKGFRPQAALGSGDFPCKWRFDIKTRCLRPHRRGGEGLGLARDGAVSKR